MSKKMSHTHDYLVVHVPAVSPNLRIEDNHREHEALAENIQVISSNTRYKVIFVVEWAARIGEQLMGKKESQQIRNGELVNRAVGEIEQFRYWGKIFSDAHIQLWNTYFPDMSVSSWITEQVRNFRNQVDTALDAWITPLVLAKNTDVIGDVCELFHPENIYCMINGMLHKNNTQHKIIHTEHLKDREIHAAMQNVLWEIGAGQVFHNQTLALLRAHTVEWVTLFDWINSTLIEHVEESANTWITFLA